MNSTPRDAGFLELALRRDIALRAIKVMSIVGPILIAINHGGAILDGTLTVERWMKMTMTMAVPYCVSTYSSVATVRRRATEGE